MSEMILIHQILYPRFSCEFRLLDPILKYNVNVLIITIFDVKYLYYIATSPAIDDKNCTFLGSRALHLKEVLALVFLLYVLDV